MVRLRPWRRERKALTQRGSFGLVQPISSDCAPVLDGDVGVAFWVCDGVEARKWRVERLSLGIGVEEGSRI